MWALPTAGGDFLHNYNTFGSEAQQISLCGELHQRQRSQLSSLTLSPTVSKLPRAAGKTRNELRRFHFLHGRWDKSCVELPDSDAAAPEDADLLL